MTPVKLPSTEKKQFSSTTGNAAFEIILGLRGSGKTSFCLDLVENKNPVIFCPGATNPDIVAMKWMYNSGPEIKRALERKNRVVYCYQPNLELFSFLEGDGLTLVLDDVSILLADSELRTTFEKKWMGCFRWRQQKVYLTTHRPRKSLPPAAYDMATKIYWVGPLQDKEEADILWTHRDQDLDKEEYYAKLKSLVPYDYRAKNVTESVFQIKSH